VDADDARVLQLRDDAGLVFEPQRLGFVEPTGGATSP
jgi:hypothetical protein